MTTALTTPTLPDVKEKSHKGQRHKGCPLCDRAKQSGNAKDRRPVRDQRLIDSANADVEGE